MDKIHNSPSVRCAIYVRAATNDNGSLVAQEQHCRAAAANHAWQFDEGLIFSDNGTSGLRGNDREGLRSLLQRAMEQPRPFDYVLFDDTSRLGRNLSIVFSTVATLVHHGVSVYFVSEGLDSGDPNFRLMLTTRAMVADEYSRALSAKVRRGQYGRVLQGFTPGGRCYGYASHPDLVQDAANGKSRRLGSKLRIVPSEAETIRTIYRLFADGVNVSQIVRRLNDSSVSGPKKPATSEVPNSWTTGSVRRILKRERYRGTVVWGRTTRLRHPAADRSVKTRKPECDAVRVPMPELRIVDDELAARIDARLNSTNEPGDG